MPRQTRVSHVDLYRIWKAGEDLDVGWLLNKLTTDEPSPKMLAGTAFHQALELSDGTDAYTLHALGYTFHILCDIDLALPPVREVQLSRQYGDLIVNGRLDGLSGNTVIDYKTTEQFDADRYMESLQWRFYLDLSGADRFNYQIFQMSECGELTYEVYAYHALTQYRYADLHKDCAKAAEEYYRFAEQFLPTLATV
jgi:hypothetical protein